MSAVSGIKAGEYGNWKYPPFGGKGGVDSYVFNDEIFDVNEQQAKDEAAAFLKQEEEEMAAMARETKNSDSTRGAIGRGGAQANKSKRKRQEPA